MRHTRHAGVAGWGERKRSRTTCLISCCGSARAPRTSCLAPQPRSKPRFMNCGICCAFSTPVRISFSGGSCSAAGPTAQRALPIVKGEETPTDERTPGNGCVTRFRREAKMRCLQRLRLQLGLPDQTFFTDRGFGSLGFLEQQAVGQALAPGFLSEHNPIVRHTVLRRRQTLEEAGLLEQDWRGDPSEPERSATALRGS